MSAFLQHRLRTHRGRQGIYSVCSASPWVIEAAMQQALADGSHLLVEATSNQVNQGGGYTGMQPADFVRFLHTIAASSGFPPDRLLLGGDHLGPNVWQHLDANTAMHLAGEMMRQYAAAGFAKLHLDASMRCADDPPSLPDEVMAERAARLCAAAESAAHTLHLERISYVIGTEVPTPGGADHTLSSVEVTSSDAVERTLRLHREAFDRSRLSDAWQRVLAIVVQPGVEFDHDHVIDYDPARARHLQSFLAAHPELVMEAHSTDYQTPRGLRDLIRDGFAILKVGPALTFAQREALFALEQIERCIVPASSWSHLHQTLEDVMLARPGQWQKYYRGNPHEQALLRTYSYSDRLRYFWGDPAVEASVATLLRNLEATEIPETLLSQHLPQQYEQVRSGTLPPEPKPIVLAKIRAALQPYSDAVASPI